MAILNVQKQNQLDWEYNVNLTTDFGQEQKLNPQDDEQRGMEKQGLFQLVSDFIINPWSRNYFKYK